MRVAVVSHACVVETNQRLFDELCGRGDVELLMIAPRRWRASTGVVVDYQPLPGASFQSRPLPVIGSGQISLHLYRGLASALRRFKPDIVYLDEEPYSLAAWQVLRICQPGGYPLCFATEQNLMKRFPWPFSRLERRTLDYAGLALPSSPAAADVLRAKHFDGEIVVIPHSVDTAAFRPMDASDLRVELGVTSPVIGYLGRLAEEKGLEDLTRAAEMLWERGVDASVLIVGGGRMADGLRAWCRRWPEGRAALTGPVPHSAAPQYINVFDVMALPSRTMPNMREQFGRVLLEAAACEVPVVGSHSGNIPRLIEELGSGVLFREWDPAALADALQELIEDPDQRARLGRRGRRNAERLYGLRTVADRLYEALSAVLD
ncbi:MAG: glycosyltransferase [Armatimonadota bacterium]|nr:glycosyltransferase [Armatimonadota bacterium]